jgi:hypothetical protein
MLGVCVVAWMVAIEVSAFGIEVWSVLLVGSIIWCRDNPGMYLLHV